MVRASSEAVPCLNIFLRAVRSGVSGLSSRFGSNIDAKSRSILYRHVRIIGDVQLLGSQAFVSLPDLESLAVRSEVRVKIEAVFSIGILVGRDTNRGAAGFVSPSLEGKVIAIV